MIDTSGPLSGIKALMAEAFKRQQKPMLER